MSTIKATTLSNLAGSKTVPTDTVVDGSAKAWVNFNGTGTVAIRRAFNVSSITDVGIGQYTANFTAGMSDVNYCGIMSPGVDSTSTGAGTFSISVANTKSSTQFGMRTARPDTGAVVDASEVNVAIFS